MERAPHPDLAGPMSTHGRHTSRAARTEAARQLDAARARTRAWLSITAACVLLGLASPLVLPPLVVPFAALAALAASRWRHHHRATGALTRRRPRPSPPTAGTSERRASDSAAGNDTRAQ